MGKLKYDFGSGLRHSKHLLIMFAGIWLISAGQMVLANSTAYVGTGSGVFGTIDLNTGVFNDLGSLGITPAGMGMADGTLYVTNWEQANGKLYSVNTLNGSLTTIGSSTVAYLTLALRLPGGFMQSEQIIIFIRLIQQPAPLR